MNYQQLFHMPPVRRALIFTGIVVVLYLLVSTFVIGGIRVYLAVNDAVAPLAGLVASLFFARVGRQQKDRSLRNIWYGLALGYALWAVADTIWGVSEVILKQEVPFPSIADFLFVGAYVPIFYALITRLTTFRIETTNQQKLLIGLISGIVTVLTLIFVLGPIITTLSFESLVAGLLNILYPLADLGLAITACIILVLLNKGRFAVSWYIMLTGLVMMTFSDLLFSYTTWNDLYHHDGNINTLTVLVDVTYALSYISSALGIFLYSKIQQAKDTYLMRIETAPLVRYYAVVYTNRENKIIINSNNFYLLFDVPPETIYDHVPLDQALGLSMEDATYLSSLINSKAAISNLHFTITTASGLHRSVWLSAMIETDYDGVPNGANIALRANLNVPENLRLPQSSDMQGVLRHLLAYAGSLGKDESPSLRAYFIEVIRLLSSLLHQFGGVTFQNALFDQLNQTAARNRLGVVLNEQVITLPEGCDGEDMARILLPLMNAARIFTAGVIGEQVVENEIQELEHQLDPGILRDLEKYRMRV